MNNGSKGNYAVVNGLKMYYEIHGTGQPLVLLHGGYMIIDALGPLLPALAESRQVIAIELEGHGRTADLDRPLSYEQMGDDVAALLGQLGIKQADIIGYSMGGTTALSLAIRHPEVVRRLVVLSAAYSKEGFYPEVVAQWPGMSPEVFAGSPMEQAYTEYAPNPQHWPIFVEKMKHLLMDFKGWTVSDIEAIKTPVLLMLGDSDLIRPEYALEMLRLLGGGKVDVYGMGGIPHAQLAILPNTNHFSILTRIDLLLPTITPFLDTPMPGAN